jgi:hypothetical protein
VKAAESQTDAAIIKTIAGATKELLDNTAGLKVQHEDGSYITVDDLRARKLPANTDKFLVNPLFANMLV